MARRPTIRSALFWLHLVVGLAASLPLAAMAVTGILIAFEPQILEALEPRRDLASRRVPAGAQAPLLHLDSLVAHAAPRAVKVTAVTVHRDAAQAVEIRMGKEAAIWVDPASGAVLGRSGALRRAFAATERLHRWLGSKEIGGPITGVSVLLCLMLAASGLVLWWPRSAAALVNVVWPRRGLRGRARDRQWHNAFGVLVLPLFAVLSATGAVMAWPWAEAALYAASGSEAPRRDRPGPPAAAAQAPNAAPDRSPGIAGEGRRMPGPAGSGTQVRAWQDWLDAAVPHAPAGWATVVLRAPDRPGKGPQAMFRGVAPHAPSGGTVGLRSDGSFESWKPARTDLGTRLRFLVKPLHTGQLFGVPGQIAMAVASAGVLVLVWTGLALGLRRLRANRSKREKKRQLQAVVS